ncbi:39S ribosomal protein L22, mitochondrial-like isoform X2 [Lytechinus variegatus]|uniref:39S ribosomal protein L22, mitochondrial-like isoform X2 n=1 Tax=Lytechinus variegatus TaxID=7654 RepID=UPI001BB158CF|nr:39S ribosomal protein L22, mitochondrial-like isoform X2 [Lytechinus variegatus]
MPRNKWLLGRVVEIYPGKDKLVRSAKVKVVTGELTRPIYKLCLLESVEFYYARKDIKHSYRKMWYITTFIKGMMIDDAIVQLEHVNKKAAKIAREALLEAQEEAVKNHNVEFKSNLHIGTLASIYILINIQKSHDQRF